MKIDWFQIQAKKEGLVSGAFTPSVSQQREQRIADIRTLFGI